MSFMWNKAEVPKVRIHYTDGIVSAMASQIASLMIVYSFVYSGTEQRKHQKLRVTGLCKENSPVTGEFPAQKVSNAENVSIWWRHRDAGDNNNPYVQNSRKECEVSRILDIAHWTLDIPISNVWNSMCEVSKIFKLHGSFFRWDDRDIYIGCCLKITIK